MFVQRLRRWPNSEPTMGPCLVFHACCEVALSVTSADGELETWAGVEVVHLLDARAPINRPVLC